MFTLSGCFSPKKEWENQSEHVGHYDRVMTEEELVQAKCVDVGSLNKDCVCNAAAW